ncbi:MAG TPA: hypothetical protein VE075_07020 [Thermoanaerobaculia bacterium]|nr:hypothetical protein [Thermoanaerobaculia bacterium]
MAPKLWRDPDFFKLWTAQGISEIGSRITREGIPLTALLVLHAGAVGARLGVRPTLALGACGLLLSTLWLLAAPLRRLATAAGA